jgi:intracellular sulfur oxidation DsrE/DsrF family protein
MKYFFLLALVVCSNLFGQTPVNPVIQNFGTVIDAPSADLKPDPSLTYNIVVDLMTGEEDKSVVAFSVNQLARLMNLHVMGGVPKENINVVVAVHGGALWTTLGNKLYREKFGVDNPHAPLYKELIYQGVKIMICSQSLFKRKVDKSQLLPGFEVATSALTTLTMYQLKGYALVRF